jgi:hypothetical protein
MIGVRLDGRLGNQMFQYAFAYAESKRKNTSFFIDQLKSNFIVKDYFDLNGYHPFMNSLKVKLFYSFLKNNYATCKEEAGGLFDADADTGNKAYFHGYFQSEKYFSAFSDEIKREFTIRPHWKRLFGEKYAAVFRDNKTIAIHVRKTDYTDLGILQGDPKDMSLPDDFFTGILKRIQKADDYRIIFISDDIDYCRRKFSHIPNACFENNEMIIDMQILMNADICIISHSSFSWWGAYLNRKKNCRVYAPKNWWGYKEKVEKPLGIMSVGWNWIDVV